MSALAWPVLVPVPPLADDVHVWCARLTGDLPTRSHLEQTLSPGERERAARYLHAATREQFLLARSILRVLLGAYLNLAPAVVPLGTGQGGKPLLEAPYTELHFNVSHSHGLALLAFTRRRPVGIDVEWVRPYAAHRDMAGRFFTATEADRVRQLPPGRSEEAFFHVWTRKEAFLKAVGLGLAGGLDSFEVSVPPDDPARILHIHGNSEAGRRWSLVALAPCDAYVGTLAIESSDFHLRRFAYPEP